MTSNIDFLFLEAFQHLQSLIAMLLIIKVYNKVPLGQKFRLQFPQAQSHFLV